jgi:glycine hydroxymethyltransferase
MSLSSWRLTARKEIFGAEARECAAAFGCAGEYGGFSRVASARRPDFGNESVARRAFDARASDEFFGDQFAVSDYGVNRETERIDYDELQKIAEETKPKMIVCGASAYPRTIDFQKIGEIAKSVGAIVMADIAHIAGLVAVGLHPSPISHCEFVTTTDA